MFEQLINELRDSVINHDSDKVTLLLSDGYVTIINHDNSFIITGKSWNKRFIDLNIRELAFTKCTLKCISNTGQLILPLMVKCSGNCNSCSNVYNSIEQRIRPTMADYC